MKNDLPCAAQLLKEGNLDGCHQIVQENEGPDGNYLHAILHRREGDFENSLYWYRRVGDHPVLQQMAERFPGWNFETFIESNRARAGEIVEQEAHELSLILRHIK